MISSESNHLQWRCLHGNCSTFWGFVEIFGFFLAISCNYDSLKFTVFSRSFEEFLHLVFSDVQVFCNTFDFKFGKFNCVPNFSCWHAPRHAVSYIVCSAFNVFDISHMVVHALLFIVVLDLTGQHFFWVLFLKAYYQFVIRIACHINSGGIFPFPKPRPELLTLWLHNLVNYHAVRGLHREWGDLVIELGLSLGHLHQLVVWHPSLHHSIGKLVVC